MTRIKSFISIGAGLLTGVAYGVVARLVFGDERFGGLFVTFSIGFLFLVPLVLGALTVYFAPESQRNSWPYAVFAPAVSCLICFILAAVLAYEAAICLIIALPIFLAMSSIGGVITYVILKWTKPSGQSQTNLIALLALAPYLLTPVEYLFPARASIRAVHSQIEINAEAETVWRNTIRLSPIQASERPFSLYALAGLPQPMEAMLTNEGTGGVRYGHWEYGLSFAGTITAWKPNEGFTVSLKADTSAVTAMPLQEIGGKYFDMVDDSYAIEPLSNGKVRLHLFSTYRLTTRFNVYSSLWIDLIMRDIQQHILRIVKARAEAQP